MKRPISLAHLSAVDLPPPALIEAAARAGFDAVGLRLLRVTDTSPGYPLMKDASLMADTKAALRDTGLRVNDIEFVKIEPETDIGGLGRFLDAGGELGAEEVICAPYDPDLHRLSDRLGQLSEMAKGRGLRISLEFFPWTPVPNLEIAHGVVQLAGPDVGILVDTLHFDRSESTIDQLRKVPGHRLRLAHLCDAPVRPSYTTQELLHTARVARLPPGDGEIGLAAILTALPEDTLIGIEVPMSEAATLFGVTTVLDQLMESARSVLTSAVLGDAAQTGGEGAALHTDRRSL